MDKRPIRISVDEYTDLSEINNWCVANFGKQQKSPATKNFLEIYVKMFWAEKITAGWACQYGHYYFTKEEDAALFLLRWKGVVISR